MNDIGFFALERKMIPVLMKIWMSNYARENLEGGKDRFDFPKSSILGEKPKFQGANSKLQSTLAQKLVLKM